MHPANPHRPICPKFLAYSAKNVQHSLRGTEWDARPVPIKMPGCQRKNILSHSRKKFTSVVAQGKRRNTSVAHAAALFSRRFVGSVVRYPVTRGHYHENQEASLQPVRVDGELIFHNSTEGRRGRGGGLIVVKRGATGGKNTRGACWRVAIGIEIPRDASRRIDRGLITSTF